MITIDFFIMQFTSIKISSCIANQLTGTCMASKYDLASLQATFTKLRNTNQNFLDCKISEFRRTILQTYLSISTVITTKTV